MKGSDAAAIVVVTGASRGIGRATAIAFAARGCHVLCWGRPSEALSQTVAAIRAGAGEVTVVNCDVAECKQVAAAAKTTLQLGTPLVVVNNAGICQRGPRLHELSVEDFDRVMAVNLRGPFLVTRSLLPAMLERGVGRVIHMASVSSTIACAQMSHYGASKWGLLGLSKSLAAELKGTGVMSIALLPGSVDTDMLKLTPFPAEIPPEHVADVAVYYGLDAPETVNGAAVEVFGP